METSKELKLEKNMMIVSETDIRGIIKYANLDFIKMSEYDKTEILGKPHNILRHPDMPKSAFEDMWTTIQNNKVWNGVVKNKTKYNNYYWVNATVYKSFTPDGTPRYISVRTRATLDEIKKAEIDYNI